MTQGPVEYCTSCGTPITANDRFCTRCGAPRQAPAAAQAPTFAQQAGQAAQTARQAYGAVAQVAGVAGMAASLPWQTIVAGETPDLRAMLSRAAVPGARTLAQRSLKKPGLSMAVTTVLDLFVAGLSGGAGALVGALPRVLAGGTDRAALAHHRLQRRRPAQPHRRRLARNRARAGGLARRDAHRRRARRHRRFLSLAPMAVAMGSALVMALKTASVALRRRS